MVLPLSALEGISLSEIKNRLSEEGYRPVRETDTRTAFAGSEDMIWISRNPDVFGAFYEACRRSDNKLLPRVEAHQVVNGGDYHAARTERLFTLEEIAPSADENRTQGGIARAYSSYPLGDEIHQSVHAGMAMSEEMEGLVCVLEKTIIASLNGPFEAAAVFSADPGRIMFRKMGDGLHQCVYADPLDDETSFDAAIRSLARLKSCPHRKPS